jgi:hypothetical protein
MKLLLESFFNNIQIKNNTLLCFFKSIKLIEYSYFIHDKKILVIVRSLDK